MAYSIDNGKTFKKYARNPILTSTQRDFRDPKVIWHEDTKKWIMILAVGQEMQLYSSPNLKDWTLESKFGEGQGAHGGVWECLSIIDTVSHTLYLAIACRSIKSHYSSSTKSSCIVFIDHTRTTKYSTQCIW